MWISCHVLYYQKLYKLSTDFSEIGHSIYKFIHKGLKLAISIFLDTEALISL